MNQRTITGPLARTLLRAADRTARRAGIPNPFDIARITLAELARGASGADFFHEVQDRVHHAGFHWPQDT
ncbi:hypothetical protein [Streptomyces sp. NBC_01244]|uniref:hypothetical protein n=1 Tax=Streptomyces sp. NBC_01244 TaxID=2903797 RepID=UPI002E128C87|nr:hypothetical protein OG247_43955 [Streptomyces sp. NBC_01244]